MHAVDNTGNGVCGTSKAAQMYQAFSCLDQARAQHLNGKPVVLWDVGGGACQCVMMQLCGVRALCTYMWRTQVSFHVWL
jgi:hypothetical protein